MFNVPRCHTHRSAIHCHQGHYIWQMVFKNKSCRIYHIWALIFMEAQCCLWECCTPIVLSKSLQTSVVMFTLKLFTHYIAIISWKICRTFCRYDTPMEWSFGVSRLKWTLSSRALDFLPFFRLNPVNYIKSMLDFYWSSMLSAKMLYACHMKWIFITNAGFTLKYCIDYAAIISFCRKFCSYDSPLKWSLGVSCYVYV